jgi:hypothetical protein
MGSDLVAIRHAIRMKFFDYHDSDETGCPACGWFESHKPDCLLATVREELATTRADGLHEMAEAACKAICGHCKDGYAVVLTAMNLPNAEHYYTHAEAYCKASEIRRAAAQLGVRMEKQQPQ